MEVNKEFPFMLKYVIRDISGYGPPQILFLYCLWIAKTAWCHSINGFLSLYRFNKCCLHVEQDQMYVALSEDRIHNFVVINLARQACKLLHYVEVPSDLAGVVYKTEIMENPVRIPLLILGTVKYFWCHSFKENADWVCFSPHQKHKKKIRQIEPTFTYIFF